MFSGLTDLVKAIGELGTIGPDFMKAGLTDPEIQEMLSEGEREVLRERLILGVPTGGVIQTGPLVDWLNDRVTELRKTEFPGEALWVSDLPLSVRIIKARSFPNAASTPWGRIYLTTALLERVNSEAELMGILAHEIVHFEKMHFFSSGIAPLIGALAKLLELRAVNGSGRVPYLEEWVENWADGFMADHSFDHEFEADGGGLLALAETGYLLDGMAKGLRTVSTLTEKERAFSDRQKDLHHSVRSGNKVVRGSRMLAVMMSHAYKTHPETTDRIKKLDDRKATILQKAYVEGTFYRLNSRGQSRQFLDRLMKQNRL